MLLLQVQSVQSLVKAPEPSTQVLLPVGVTLPYYPSIPQDCVGINPEFIYSLVTEFVSQQAMLDSCIILLALST